MAGRLDGAPLGVRRRAVAKRWLILTAIWASSLPAAAQQEVSCAASPDCAALRRQPCDPFGTVPNACGDCLLGTHGGPGPTNTLCVSNSSCAAIFPGSTACYVPISTSYIPVLVPFGSCVCDDGDGLRWPTSQGRCAKVEVGRAGDYFLQRCNTRTCEPSSCSDIASWAPLVPRSVNDTFSCTQSGSDSVYLADRCEDVLGDLADRALCGHPGYMNGDLDGDSPFLVNCGVSPACPQSVSAEGEDRLEDRCCNGHPYSFLLDENMQSTGVAAPGFCAPPAENRPNSLIGLPLEVVIVSGHGFKDLDTRPGMGRSDIFCTGEIPTKPQTRFATDPVDDTVAPVWNRRAEIRENAPDDTLLFLCYDQDFGDANDPLGSAIVTSQMLNRSEIDEDLEMLQQGETVGHLRVRIRSALVVTAFACAVQTSGPGWLGCSCLDGVGRPRADRVCTVRCEPPGCTTPEGGIPPTPVRWATSELPIALQPPDRSVRIAASSAGGPDGSPRRLWLPVALASVSLWGRARVL